MINDLIILTLRTPISYLVILAFFRLTGKKELSEISVLDIGITLMIADLAVRMIDNPEINLLIGVAPIFLLITIQFLFSFLTMKSQTLRHIINGRPTPIIYEGKCHQKNMRKNGYNLNDLFAQLREQNIPDVRDVEYAFLENSGNLTIFRKGETFSLPLIQDGILQKDHMLMMKLTEPWLNKALARQGFDDYKKIFICSYADGKLYIEEKN
ncbi:Uncharacterized membrane protein YcaP, DUF421 family [Amphibacillus marinus]|uniref:Uncharacterized membrane protein YcaP, DUF421 family n=1 Tax=Amphibacillus marinus TaxID=872970 RepID=A0A1H8KE94_9BACI|nr:DUF421 domain-containing protein [Amphibacillus marinus]SEN91087.1 Uncharacterized membrane protein YcaP, DUF421 family [Amphibacillus marinus]